MSRISKPSVSSEDYVDSSNDHLWHETITLSIEANRQLSADQRTLVEKDFGMIDGALELTVRKALAHYALHRFQAGITDSDQSDMYRFPITVTCKTKSELNDFLFGINPDS